MIKKASFLFAIVTLVLINLSFVKEEKTYNITVEITGVENKKGSIILALYNHINQYTDNPWKNFKKGKNTMVNDTVTFVIKNIPSGQYAISFLDDENDNKKMDYSFWGFPQEGYGFSNNVKPSILGAPKYEKCSFMLNKDTKLNLNVLHWSK